MFKSKPIGWITAGTLVCAAGLAVACRLKDGKGSTAQANPPAVAEAPPAAAEEPKPVTLTAAVEMPVSGPNAVSDNEKAKEPAAPLLPTEPTETSPPPVMPAPASVTPPDTGKPTSLPDAAPKCDSPTPSAPPSLLPPPPVDVKSVDKATPTKADMPIPPPTVTPMDGLPATPVTTPITPTTTEQTTTPRDWNEPIPPVKKVEGPSATIPVPAVTPVPSPVVYKVESKGETLRDIAQRTLGSGNRWREIEKMNPEVQAVLLVPVGTMIKLPAEAKLPVVNPAVIRVGFTEPGTVTPPSDLQPLPTIRAKPLTAVIKSSQPLTGSYPCTCDPKKTLTIPEGVKQQLSSFKTVLLTPGPDGCLWLATRESADRMLTRIEKADLSDKEVRAFRRLYFAQSEKVIVTTDGVVAVPDKLAEYAGLSKEVVLVGNDDHFELWDAARWKRHNQHDASNPTSTEKKDPLVGY